MAAIGRLASRACVSATAAPRAAAVCRHPHQMGMARPASTDASRPLLPPLLRSVLYVPGSNARALQKAAELTAADGVILDLEDAVAPSAKDVARQNVLDALAAGVFAAGPPGCPPRHVAVRVNAIGTPWYEADVAAVAAMLSKMKDGSGSSPRLPATLSLVLPKVESPSNIESLVEGLPSGLEAHPTTAFSVWAAVETPRGILAAPSIASLGLGVAGSNLRLTALVAGTTDLAVDLGLPPEEDDAAVTNPRWALVPHLSRLVLAARAYGLVALDGVCLDVKGDGRALRAQCAQGRGLGFDGKTLIHPSHIDPANQAFTPSPRQVAQAKAVISAVNSATQVGDGIAVVGGKLAEAPHVAEAQRVLALATAAAEKMEAVATSLAASAKQAGKGGDAAGATHP